MDAEEKRGIVGKTWNDVLKLLRSTFRHLLPQGSINPFDGLVSKETQTIFRKPFKPEELKMILDAAKDDEFIRPIVVTGVCTAMRRGDCCLLKWKDVDFDKGFVTVKTNKTGVTVDIPIFPLLFDELTARKGEDKEFVFCKQAEMYLENPDGITWRVKKILAVALGGTETAAEALPELPAEEAMRNGDGYIASLPDGPRKERMQVVFNHYMSGKKLCEVVALAGVSKGSASGYLNEVEAKVGCQIVRGRHRGLSLTARMKNDNGLLSVEREGGGRSASIRDFQSFRVTWVTLALTAGVALELVSKVTGHKTVEIVLKHYFQPGRDDFRRALESAMPKLLTNGQQSPKDEMREIVEKMSAKNWKKHRARLAALMGQ
jgi:integrase